MKIRTQKMKKNFHVVPHSKSKGWAVKRDGSARALKVTATQKEAIEFAEEQARKFKTDTKIHGRDGRIRAGNSYGNDPCPPKDKK